MKLLFLSLGLSGGALILAHWIGKFVFRALRERYGVTDDLVIPAPIVKFAGFDPTVRERTMKRRQAADDIRKRAAHVETGAPVAKVLEMARRA